MQITNADAGLAKNAGIVMYRQYIFYRIGRVNVGPRAAGASGALVKGRGSGPFAYKGPRLFLFLSGTLCRLESNKCVLTSADTAIKQQLSTRSHSHFSFFSKYIYFCLINCIAVHTLVQNGASGCFNPLRIAPGVHCLGPDLRHKQPVSRRQALLFP